MYAAAIGWDMPAKFALSFLLFAPTLRWLFAHVERTKWIRRGLGALGWSMVIEVLLITAQSYRGRAWHYNNQIDSCRPEYDEAFHRFMY